MHAETTDLVQVVPRRQKRPRVVACNVVGQSNAIRAILEGKALPVVAKEAGVSERTVSRWLTEETFQDGLRSAQERIRTELISLKVGVQKEILEGGKETVQCPHCGKRTTAACSACGGALTMPDWKVRAMVANELERSSTSLDKLVIQRLKPDKRRFRVVFGDAEGGKVGVQIEEEVG